MCRKMGKMGDRLADVCGVLGQCMGLSASNKDQSGARGGVCAVREPGGVGLEGVALRFMRARGRCDREGGAWAEFWSSFGGHNPRDFFG